MADALCGPSNALQSFQKHAQVDRTLQQDRLTGPRHSPAQGFRSFDPRTGSLDADFRAFENASPNPFQLADPLLNQPAHHLPQFQHVAHAPAPNWATDFQRLNISDRPLPVQQFRMEAPLIRSAPGGWQNEFMRQRENSASPIVQGKQAMSEYQNAMVQHAPLQGNAFQNYSSFQVQQPSFGQTSQDGSAQMANQDFEQISASDWSQAFQEAFDSADLAEIEQVQSDVQDLNRDQILHQDGTYTNDHSQANEPPAATIQEPLQTLIGSDAIQYTEMQDRTADQDVKDANALARVAGELLHNIQHESDEKFQNSQFLDLMRKIRDRQVEVRNNDFETTNATATTSFASETTTEKGKEKVFEPLTDLRPHAPETEDQRFNFPDMNEVYASNPAEGEQEVDYTLEFEEENERYLRPQTQLQDLHPGGRLYPGAVNMSGAINAHTGGSGGGNGFGHARNISADDFDYLDESHVLGNVFSTGS